MTVGPFQIVIIALIVLLLFGRGRVNQSLGELGQGVRALRKRLNEPDTLAPGARESFEPQGTADK